MTRDEFIAEIASRIKVFDAMSVGPTTLAERSRVEASTLRDVLRIAKRLDSTPAMAKVQPVASDWREFASRIERVGNYSDCPGDGEALLGIARQMREIALQVEKSAIHAPPALSQKGTSS